MRVLVLVELRQGRATADSLGLVGLARDLGVETCAAVLGHRVGEAAEAASHHGAAAVFAVDAPELSEPLPDAHADVLERLVRDQEFDAILLSNSILAADIAGALAVALEAGLNWDLVDLSVEDGQLVGERLVFGDSLRTRVGWRRTPGIGLVRPGVAEPKSVSPQGTVMPWSVSDEITSAIEFVHREPVEEEGASLEDADVIVAGGKGIGSAENFRLLESLAEELGGAVGATRAVVELGWYPQSAQVGQTGKTVAPKLYVACGISGAIHHKVGMHQSNVIVAVNTDRSAPIFDFCDLAVVADAERVVSELTELLRQRRASP